VAVRGICSIHRIANISSFTVHTQAGAKSRLFRVIKRPLFLLLVTSITPGANGWLIRSHTYSSLILRQQYCRVRRFHRTNILSDRTGGTGEQYSSSALRLASKSNMPRGVKKENLPSKTCVVCNRPFTWRKKWERCWDEVTTCSKSCNRRRKEKARSAARDTSRILSQEPPLDHPMLEDSLYFNEGSEQSLLATIRSELQVEECVGASGTAHDGSTDSSAGNESDMCSSDGDISLTSFDDAKARAKAERKAAKKAKKAARRALREGRGDPTAGQKPCDMCGKSVNLLIRCTYDESGDWKMVCGKCWNIASGGVIDGDAQHPHYRYGGLWKNRRA